VHADVPAGLSWADFTGGIDNPQFQDIALRGRERIKKPHRGGVLGDGACALGTPGFRKLLGSGTSLLLMPPVAVMAPWRSTLCTTTVDGKAGGLDQAAQLGEQLGELEQFLLR